MSKEIQNQAFSARQKSILLTEKARVEEELKAINKFPQYGDTEEANAQEIERLEGYKGMEKELKQLLKEIERALELLEKNQYGTCQVCNNLIDRDRLEVFPAADTCVSCSNKHKIHP